MTTAQVRDALSQNCRAFPSVLAAMIDALQAAMPEADLSPDEAATLTTAISSIVKGGDLLHALPNMIEARDEGPA